MIIAATGDIHSPQYYDEFVRAVDTMKAKPDLFLMVGDMIGRGEINEYEKIYNALFGKINCPIVSCFGNNEFIPDMTHQIKERFKEIRFLWDDSAILKIGFSTIGIIGTLGSLDVPTRWQKLNIPNIESIYNERFSFVERHIRRLMVNYKIILMHYAPTFKTLEGENPNFYGSLGSRAYEDILIKMKPDLVLHGHSHKGKKMAWLDSVPVFNVSFPVNREIVIIDTNELKPGLTRYI
jgi:Icc-related predicted phosphoesterase